MKTRVPEDFGPRPAGRNASARDAAMFIMCERDKSDDYRDVAAKCLSLARRTSDCDDHAILVEMAARWRALSQQLDVEEGFARGEAARLRGDRFLGRLH
jgi:hypothetical protein